LNAKDEDSVRGFIEALRQFEGKAPGAAPLLVELAVREPRDEVGILACIELRAFGEGVVPALVGALRDADSEPAGGDDSPPASGSDVLGFPFGAPFLKCGPDRALYALKMSLFTRICG